MISLIVKLNNAQRSGLCAAGEIDFRPARLTDDENRNKS